MKSKILNTTFSLLSVLIILGLATVKAKGQSLLTLLPTNTTYSTAQLQDINKISAASSTADYRLVQLGSMENNQTNGFLTFSIPGMETSSFVGKVEMVETDNFQGTVWSGSIQGQTGSYFSFGSNPYSSSGYIKLQDKFYSLLPMGGDKCILVKHEQSAYKTEGCTMDDEAPTGREADECDEEYNVCAATIDVLLLVTPEARAYLSSGFDFWGLAIFSGLANSSINLAFQNSDIPNKQVSIKAIENFSLTVGYSSPPNIDSDTEALVNDANAKALRNLHRADIVVMLTNQVYLNTDGGQIFGNTAEVNASNSNAYIIVEVPYMIAPRWTLAHEVAHVFGARHNRSSNGGNDDVDVCAHARRFDDADNVERRTLLATMGLLPNDPFSGDGRILHYSNPDVDFSGAATSTQNNDNSKAIRNTGCIVANFRAANMNAKIGGQGIFCKHGQQKPQVYEAIVESSVMGTPGQPPYTYEWRWSPNPSFSPSYVLGTTHTITITDVLTCPHFYLRLRVTSSDGITVTQTRWISTVDCEICDQYNLAVQNGATPGTPTDASMLVPNHSLQTPFPLADGGSIASAQHLSMAASIYPNPSASNPPTLALVIDEAADVQVVVQSAAGTTVGNMLLGNMAAGSHHIRLGLESVPPGVYFCRILAGDLSKTLKIVLTR